GDNAEVILVGGVFSVYEIGTTEVQVGGQTLSAKVLNAEVHPDRVLKGGSVPPKAVVRFVTPISPAGWVGYVGIDAPSYRILFLKRADDHFELANWSVPPLPALPGAVQSNSANPLEAVISELGAVLDSPQTPEVEKLGLIYRLGSTPNAAVIGVLRPKLSSSS